LNNNYFQNKKILITAGPTYEKLDPVRFIGNFSTGKMGYALAEELANEGAKVILISGPTCLNIDHPNITVIPIVSANEMLHEALTFFPQTDLTILAAAVADYRPKEFSETKIKKNEDDLTIYLVKNPDIFKTLGQLKTKKQIIIGFALETNNEIENAQMKLKNKNGDAIILNSLNDIGAGFKYDTNKISIILKNGLIFEYSLKTKNEVAQDILQCISDNF
jgi:phosphopantothenoylcysteine decarboxylase / phosphopantothenate---cysteine ligase